MTVEMWIVLVILVVAIIFFVTEWLRVDVVALSVVVLLMISGVLDASEALAGFSNSAVLTIAALFIVGGGILQTGLAGTIGRRVLEVAGGGETRLLVVLMLTVALLSGFMSDTGTVAVLLPAVVMLAQSARISTSKLLIPLSFGSLLGGAATLIGTPPNIIVSDLLRESGYEPFSFFTYTPMGLILITIGIVFMVFVGRRLLPARQTHVTSGKVFSPAELVDEYQLPDNLYRLRVRRNSDLVNRTLAAAGFRAQYGITILDILRLDRPRLGPHLARPRGHGTETVPTRSSFSPTADTVIQLGDVLIVRGDPVTLRQAAAEWDLGLMPADPGDKEEALLNNEVGVAEILLPPGSSLLGQTIAQSDFARRHKLLVLGLRGPSTTEELDLQDTPLRFGDILLVQGAWKNILALKERRREFVIIGQPEVMLAGRRHRAGWALAILLLMLLAMITDALPVATATMGAGLLMVLTGCLSMDDAYEAIDWKSVVLVAGMLPMSTALGKVGLVDVAANGLVNSFGQMGPLAVLAGLFLITSLFTQVLSNTATTVVIAPIALVVAQSLGVLPQAFMMSVAIAASMAFASPVASPTNTLVLGAGEYRFSDYIKVGVPLIFLMLVATVIFLPLLFPFY